MAGPNINTKIKFDGEKEYKQAISDINAALGVLNSEMRKVSEEFKSNAGSVEALTARNDVLERTLSTQKDKVEQIRQALQKAAEAYGESDSRTMRWQKSLNDAEAEVLKTENAIRENNEALADMQVQMGETSDSGKGLGEILDSLAGKFGVDLPEGIKTSLDSMGTFSTGSVAAIGAVAASVAALIKLYDQLIEKTVESAANADNILTLSQITGLNTETIQEFQYMAELIDVSFDTIKGSMTKLTSNMDKARDGNAKLEESFNSLGVSVTDSLTGQLRPAEDVFYEVIDALSQIENAAERDALCMELFGKSAQDLNPILIQGSGRMHELAAEAHNVGYVLSDDMLNALGEVDDAEQRLSKTQDALTNQMSAQMAPAVVELKTEWLEFMERGGQAIIDSHIIEGLGEILKFSLAILEPFGDLLTLIPQVDSEFQGLYKILHGIAGAFALIADVANATLGVLTGFTKAGRTRFNTAIGLNAEYGMYSNMQQWNGIADQWESWRSSSADPNYTASDVVDERDVYYGEITGNIYDHNASGNQNFSGGWTGFGENGEELAYLPSGTRILSAQDTRLAGGGDITIIEKVVIDAKNVKDFSDVVSIVKNERERRRMR
ncbi:MAG: hypothetical protein IKS55_02645 [Oscillospiraceae bacterium]|nr:hypothetical protein [Oscillospiraceae bacterium]